MSSRVELGAALTGFYGPPRIEARIAQADRRALSVSVQRDSRADDQRNSVAHLARGYPSAPGVDLILVFESLAAGSSGSRPRGP